jgi:hypothetical protein
MNTKHVIILGAGASANSGYPLANGLTLLMCDPKTFRDAVHDTLVAEGVEPGKHPFIEQAVVPSHLASVREATDMLRAGDFLTMDEMSRYAFGGSHAAKVAILKKAMRLVLALSTPDLFHYRDSDYRKFVQKLFPEGKLREDVCVISFNYDPYFEFRLFRAFQRRSQLRTYADDDKVALDRAIHSGFSSPTNLGWLERPGFCHLKLHGAAVFPWTPKHTPEDLTGGLFVARRIDEKLPLLMQKHANEEVPALLPWEIIHDDGRLLEETEFVDAVGKSWQHLSLYPLFSGLWQRARCEVQEASKISFVGISMHDYLVPGMKYLFSRKKGDVHVVVATRHKGQEAQLPPVAARTVDVLTSKLEANLRLRPSPADLRALPEMEQFQKAKQSYVEPEVTVRGSFDEFLDTELEPANDSLHKRV